MYKLNTAKLPSMITTTIIMLGVFALPPNAALVHATALSDSTLKQIPSPQETRPAVELTPFDANLSYKVGPSNWYGSYGKQPEIIVSSNGVELDVLAQDYDPGTEYKAALLHIRPHSTGYEITQALTDIPMLARVMGLAADDEGNRYYATGVSEGHLLAPTYPPTGVSRENIVRVVKLDKAGEVLFNIDLDRARHAFNGNAEMIISPMSYSSARLEVGGDDLVLVHGNRTNPDGNGIRHQKALTTRLNSANGDIIETSTVWASHSFDQRLLYDGDGVVEYHLADAYPRYLLFGKNRRSHPLFHIKGWLGENNTRTRLGNMALIENDPTYRYIALFASESTAATGGIINGPRNLAIVRVSSGDYTLDPNLPDTLTVISCNRERTNRLKWLTGYSAESNLHAERPKLIGVGEDRYIVLWEEWYDAGGYTATFNGVYGMVIDAGGNILHEATLVTDQDHLHRGDDAFLLDGRAAWMTGSAIEKQLYLHFVDTDLNYEFVPVD